MIIVTIVVVMITADRITKEAAEDRQLPDQPLHFLTNTGELLRYNLRKLGELTFHLARAGRIQDLLTHCLFNYDWLYAKVRERNIGPLSLII